jgi:hypothetical protein
MPELPEEIHETYASVEMFGLALYIGDSFSPFDYPVGARVWSTSLLTSIREKLKLCSRWPEDLRFEVDFIRFGHHRWAAMGPANALRTLRGVSPFGSSQTGRPDDIPWLNRHAS